MTESEFQDNVVDLAHIHGWRVFHARNAKVGDKHMTPIQYDGKGFPDLVLAHPDKGVIYAELKSTKGRLSKAQNEWLDVLEEATDEAQVFVWRPEDIQAIHRVLRRGTRGFRR